MSLKSITELSTYFGLNPDYVLGGGGNTSFKNGKFLYVKPSGISLASITEKDFVKMGKQVFRVQKYRPSEKRRAHGKAAGLGPIFSEIIDAGVGTRHLPSHALRLCPGAK